MKRLFPFIIALFCLMPAFALADTEKKGIDDVINSAIEPVANVADFIVFYEIPIPGGGGIPVVLIILGVTAVFLTVYFGFVNLRGFGVALKTVRGKYSSSDDPGEITHFQALSAALSATVGLGNIAGVAVAIGIGGPGATFWMILMGLFGMTTKFAECTLGVKYRKFDENGKVLGGAMYYLSEGLKERGAGLLGTILAFFFAIFVIGGAFGAGNMYQANQSAAQFTNSFLPNLPGWAFGLGLAIIVGAVIIGGIKSIARVTALIVPLMCGAYMAAALVIIFLNIGEIPSAFGAIFKGAFGGEAILGGLVGVLIQGIKRAAFSNEAGLGSAPIAHAAVKTTKPASEGYVAMLEPFVDTVLVCTVTALVIVITGTWKVGGETTSTVQLAEEIGSSEVVQTIDKGQYLRFRGKGKDEEGNKYKEVIGLISNDHQTETKVNGWIAEANIKSLAGIPVTSMAFEKVISWFPKLLAIAVLLFAFSTMISWSYYGEQGVAYLAKMISPGAVKPSIMIYKFIFCLLIVVGSSAQLGNVLKLSDALIFAMVVPNLIGLYWLLPVVRKEANDYIDYVKERDR